MGILFITFVLALLVFFYCKIDTPLSFILPILAIILCFLDTMCFKMAIFGVIFCGFSLVVGAIGKDARWFATSIVWWSALVVLQVFLYMPLFWYAFGPPTHRGGDGMWDAPMIEESKSETANTLECSVGRLFY
jgi:hypothetical protein